MKKLTTEDFIHRSKIAHGDTYNYSKSIYINRRTLIKIICNAHGEFLQFPENHTNREGCPTCKAENIGNYKRTPLHDVILSCNMVHNNTYDYSLFINYKNNKQKISIICPLHGKFIQTVQNHNIQKQGCPACVKSNGYSKKAIQWLNYIATKENIHIQHAENDGEYLIPTTKYRADGYCKETNTIYEFHGDVYHGNPTLYNANQYCHPFKKDITAGELFNITMQKENIIKLLNYNIVTIWENEWEFQKTHHLSIVK